MKVLDRFFMPILLVLCFGSCANLALPDDTISVIHDDYVIPLDDAISALDDFLLSSQTKSTIERGIESCFIIRRDVISTKADTSARHNAGGLLYVINFKDNTGFAILSADERIPDDILVVADNGCLSESEINNAYIRYKSIPRTKINPPITTIDSLECYDPLYDDWYIGDYLASMEEESGAQITDYIIGSCIDYSENQINWHTPIGEIGGDDPFTPLYDIVTQTTHNYSSPRHNTNLLTAMTPWCQSEPPYNSFINTVWPKHIVGCVNISLAKIIAYHEFPELLIVNGYTVNWYNIKNDLNGTGAISVGKLLFEVFHSTGSIPLYSGTFTLPVFASNYLTSIGYENVTYQDYDENTIIQSINQECPVFISSIPTANGLTFNIFRSHAWNIDNYRYRTTTTQRYYYLNGILDHTSTETETKTMFHCAWGWGKRCDGYYLSNVFDLTSNSCILDPNSSRDSTDIEFYNHYLKTITYDKPVF